jgi:amidohydrolase
VDINVGPPPTTNDPALTERMLPTLRRVLGNRLEEAPRRTSAEDFAFYQRQVPGMMLFLGITPDAEMGKAAENHSPRFTVDEPALLTGLRTLVHLTLDYAQKTPASGQVNK